MTEQELLLLNIANAALGLVTLVFVVMVAWGVASELLGRLRARVAAAADDHAFAVAGLGLTMADGGEKKEDEAK
jgi:hypothetical protein